MTYLSEDDWQELDRRARTEYVIRLWMVRAALAAAAACFMFVILWFVASESPRCRNDVWCVTCEAYLRDRRDGGSK